MLTEQPHTLSTDVNTFVDGTAAGKVQTNGPHGTDAPRDLSFRSMGRRLAAHDQTMAFRSMRRGDQAMRMPMRRLAGVMVLLFLCMVNVSALAAGSSDHLVLNQLQAGGYVVYLRHVETDTSQRDAHPITPGDCATQRNLSEEGRAQARRLGQVFQHKRIPVGNVLSSPFCRGLETARLAFGRAEPQEVLHYSLALSEAQAAVSIAALRHLLGAAPLPGTNTVIVGHFSNLVEAAGVRLDGEGDAFVFKPKTDGGFTEVGRIRWDDLDIATPRP